MARAQEMEAADYAKRAVERRKSGDSSGELADYDKLVELDPNEGNTYWLRGACYFRAGRWEAAAADFRRSAELAPSGFRDGYGSLFVWAARAQMGERAAADAELKEVMHRRESITQPPTVAPEEFDKAADLLETGHGRLPARRERHSKELPSARFERAYSSTSGRLSGWPLATAQFLVGEMKEKDYFSFPPLAYREPATRLTFWPTGKHSCEALFYAGLKRFVDGDKKKAIAYWQECATADGPKWAVEREFARAELQNVLGPKGAESSQQ